VILFQPLKNRGISSFPPRWLKKTQDITLL
jgi:hypothetical protein